MTQWLKEAQRSEDMSKRKNELRDYLEAETVYLNHLLHIITDHLTDIFVGELVGENKRMVEFATTLSIVARDRLDSSLARIDHTYGVKTEVSA